MIPDERLRPFAEAVADGRITIDELRPQMSPELHERTRELADLIIARRTADAPLVKLGPGADFVRKIYAEDLTRESPPIVDAIA